MRNSLLTVCAFGLFFSSALAEEKSLEQLDKHGLRIWGVEGLRKETFTRVVASGTKDRIGFFHALHPDCSASGNVNIRVATQPEHGTAETPPATNFATYPKDNIRRRIPPAGSALVHYPE
jgi:hypothetical protein